MSKSAVTGFIFAIELDRDNAGSLHQQIADGFRSAIQQGRIAVGSRLPSTRALADELHVSRNTVLRVFETLTQEGFLSSRVGDGTYIEAADEARGTARQAQEARPAAAPGRYPFRSLSRRGRSLTASAQGTLDERPTSFMPDIPDLREFPMRTWLRLLNETSGRLTGEILASAANAGYEPLRRAIAQHLNTARGMDCTPSQVIVTSGSQQSLDLVCRMLIDPGDAVWLEEPGYVGARSVIGGNGGTLCPVPVDGDGMCIESAISTHPSPRLIFTSASRQYPLGPTLSGTRRRALLQYAQRTGAWVVEDDYDNEFRFAGNAPAAIFSMDSEHRTLHLGTFSKALLPSFRLGYLVVPKDLSESFAKARTVVDRHASLIEQMALAEFMQRGLFVSHIRKMRRLYRGRQLHLLEGLKRLAGRGLQIGQTDTGLHLVLPLLNTADDTQIAELLARHGVIARPLSPYYYTRQPRKGLLLGFSAFREAEIDQGLATLARSWELIAPLIDRRPHALLLAPSDG